MNEAASVRAHLRHILCIDKCPRCGDEVGTDAGNEYSEHFTECTFTCEDCDLTWKRSVIPFKLGPQVPVQ